MIPAIASTCLLFPQSVYAQDAVKNPALTGISAATPPTLISPAILRAPVISETVMNGVAEGGGDAVVRRIKPPVVTAADLALLQPTAVKELTVVEKAARLVTRGEARKNGPLEIRLFSPSVVTWPNGVASVTWWAMDAAKNFELHEVWVSGVDMSLLPAVGDLNVGRRRWLLSAVTCRSSDKFASDTQPPTAEEFAARGGDGEPVVLVEEGGEDAAALEPVSALLAELKNKAPELTKTLAAMKAAQEHAALEAAAKAANPEPTVIHFWTSEKDEMPPSSSNQ